ncbi:hypothetical protein Tco_1269471, partial [Tanacetum coccineum]
MPVHARGLDIIQIVRKVSSWWNVDYVSANSYEEWLDWLGSLRLPAKLKLMLEGVFYVVTEQTMDERLGRTVTRVVVMHSRHHYGAMESQMQMKQVLLDQSSYGASFYGTSSYTHSSARSYGAAATNTNWNNPPSYRNGGGYTINGRVKKPGSGLIKKQGFEGSFTEVVAYAKRICKFRFFWICHALHSELGMLEGTLRTIHDTIARMDEE